MEIEKKFLVLIPKATLKKMDDFGDKKIVHQYYFIDNILNLDILKECRARVVEHSNGELRYYYTEKDFVSNDEVLVRKENEYEITGDEFKGKLESAVRSDISKVYKLSKIRYGFLDDKIVVDKYMYGGRAYIGMMEIEYAIKPYQTPKLLNFPNMVDVTGLEQYRNINISKNGFPWEDASRRLIIETMRCPICGEFTLRFGGASRITCANGCFRWGIPNQRIINLNDLVDVLELFKPND